MKFEKGKSGNPKGRPKGIRDRRVKYREQLEKHADSLIQKIVELGLEGDVTALRLCLERICPTIKTKDEPVNIGALKGSLAEQGQLIIKAMGQGDITPNEATSMLSALASQSRIVEVDDLEKRITALEGKNET
jgi:polyhydroxyalkanoate synthesis regulator phasin